MNGSLRITSVKLICKHPQFNKAREHGAPIPQNTPKGQHLVGKPSRDWHPVLPPQNSTHIPMTTYHTIRFLSLPAYLPH